MTSDYYLLLGSLPHLVRFERLKTLPISRQRFEARLALLAPMDGAVIAWLRAALWPEREPLKGSVAPLFEPPAFARALVGQAARIRTSFASRRGEDDVVAVERERLGALWDSADRLTKPHGFGIEAVARAVIRWDVATAWLAGEEARSGDRIEALAQALVERWRRHG